MKVGLIFPGMHPYESSELLLQLASSGEFDSLWLGDHFLNVFHPELFAELSFGAGAGDPDAYYDPYVLSAALGRQTELPLGIGVTDSIRRKAPDVARATLSLHQICKGGFNIGVGAGEAENLLPFGYPNDKPVARTEEFLRELRHLLDTGRMPEGIGRTGIPLSSEKGRPKLWVAGHGPRMLRLTGQYGDGWLPAWSMDAEAYGAKLRAIKGHAEAAGRPTPEAGLVVPCILGPSAEYVAELVEREPMGKLAAIFMPASIWHKHGMEHPFGPDANGFDSIPHHLDPDVLRKVALEMPFELFNEFFWCGSPAELAERVAGYVANGCEHVVLSNGTGLAGGAAEFEARIPDLFALRQLIAAL